MRLVPPLGQEDQCKPGEKGVVEAETSLTLHLAVAGREPLPQHQRSKGDEQYSRDSPQQGDRHDVSEPRSHQNRDSINYEEGRYNAEEESQVLSVFEDKRRIDS